MVPNINTFHRFRRCSDACQRTYLFFCPVCIFFSVDFSPACIFSTTVCVFSIVQCIISSVYSNLLNNKTFHRFRSSSDACQCIFLHCAFKPPEHKHLPRFWICTDAFQCIFLHCTMAGCRLKMSRKTRYIYPRLVWKPIETNKQQSNALGLFVCSYWVPNALVCLFVCIGVHTNIVHIFRPFAMYQSHSFSTRWKMSTFEFCCNCIYKISHYRK